MDIWTTDKVQNLTEHDIFDYEVPLAVMQTAISALNVSQNIEFYWDAEPQPNDPSPAHMGMIYFSEVSDPGSSNDIRKFDISVNGTLWYQDYLMPDYLHTYTVPFFLVEDRNNGDHIPRFINISLSASGNSTLPPIINAIEVFTFKSIPNVGTETEDGIHKQN